VEPGQVAGDDDAGQQGLIRSVEGLRGQLANEVQASKGPELEQQRELARLLAMEPTETMLLGSQQAEVVVHTQVLLASIEEQANWRGGLRLLVAEKPPEQQSLPFRMPVWPVGPEKPAPDWPETSTIQLVTQHWFEFSK